MQKKILVMSAALILGGVFAQQIFAADLLDVYKQALQSDPSFKAANEQWLAARENLPISRASLLPQINATGGVSRIHYDLSGVSSEDPFGKHLKYYDNNTSYSLNLTQPIFNFSSWAAVWGAKANVKQAQAVFSSSAEDLMLRVANAYFAVLQAQDTLRFTIENKKAVGEILRQQKQKFEVGLLPITDLNNAQASYDTTVAQEIADRTTLSNAEEKLQEIAGIKYTHHDLHTLKQQLPLVKPTPQNIEQWVKIAEQQNYSLLAARYNSIAARENIAQKEGGHLPTLSAVGSFGYNYDTNGDGYNDYGKATTTTAGLQLTVPLFSGGGVSAQAHQAAYQYQQAIAQQEQMHRSVVSQTRQAYLEVISGISKIQADRQIIKSKQSVLISTQNSYNVGLRTMVDVLGAESDLYDSQKTFAIDQYAYILQTLNLKQQSGTLSADDLAKINLWLEQSSLSKSLEEKDYSFESKIATPTPSNETKITVNEPNNTTSTNTTNTLNTIAATAPEVAHKLATPETSTSTPQTTAPTTPQEQKSAPESNALAVQTPLQVFAPTYVDNSPQTAKATTSNVSNTTNEKDNLTNNKPPLVDTNSQTTEAIADKVSSTTDEKNNSVNNKSSSVEQNIAAQKNNNEPQHLTRSEKYLLKKVNPKHYALQLMTSDNKQDLINFAYDNDLQDKTILYTGNNNGDKYYGLIYGDYENVHQANFAADNLSTKLNKKIAAKVMPFETLQKELRNVGE